MEMADTQVQYVVCMLDVFFSSAKDVELRRSNSSIAFTNELHRVLSRCTRKVLEKYRLQSFFELAVT
jgi:hypothetical protein